ncbi:MULTISPECIES: carbon-nitrogen hydrolase [Pseudoalteromonas]|jgi:N-carbamoylputrescine amidase|uniref:N-carbamoylputrescine amidase n=1 Tax=Pseudoalteromonas lipolytica TaxID=570156 RepID=A0ABY1GTA0_9GAMM|nr:MULTISPECIES: carbon-nitrogen hydrolase [Pseudoalteromonas]EWH06954.1 acyltransferase [Pseudoalteromonas lipolytica SCSIO 04301]MBE0350713.1 N-carbamoylputrescine amidase [Pseudoalteromonas lipolytica LMEB 39]MCC9658973.1 carbon-nitrogen hydrolase [Pseudoalteromonas sp. MB41]QLJ07015.1 carbon-nitrogen hydrolase [Pseudoalteromonas sp. JSTW]QMW13253.1 carbon-nitrogen hydrolase [Pseudoalteromonas sp. MT33b]|tara:strand:- start:7812 stop:8705 length:894 start_codon:yes stop_codon:yes gene_type:complete
MTKPTHLKVALVQQSNSDNAQENMAKSIAGIRDAASQGAKLVVLQELHRSLYFCQTEDVDVFDLAETIPGPSTDTLGALAKELNVVIVSSLFEKRATGLYHNTAVVLETDGSIAGKYRKMHIPDDPGFYEKFYFTPGDLGFQPIQTSVGKLGVLVCWDQWFPEAARLMAMAGAEILIYPTAIGWDPRDDKDEQTRQKDAWVISQRAHAVANGVPVISCNRVGHESDPSAQSEGIQFWGNSFIAGPQGEILAHANNSDEQLLVVELDQQRSENIRRIWPYLRDRRIDHYQDLTKIYRD